MDQELNILRESIDRTDQQLLRLLNERMKIALEVGRIKASKGLELFDPAREELIYERLARLNPGPLTEEALRSIYREIIAASRLLQYPLQIAFLGPEWTYSHLAAHFLFGYSAHYVPFDGLEEVFDALSKGKVQVALVPIENSFEGGAGDTLDLLYENNVQVVRECYLEIAHCLCTYCHSVEDLRHVYAHPQVLNQCRRWLLEQCPQAERHECGSTAQAAQLAKENASGAAICNLYAANHYELPVLVERIEDHSGNVTRFFALANHFNAPTGKDKTSVLFEISDQPGALYEALEPFTRRQVNITRIESRPNRIFPWQYLFYADFEGHRDEENVQLMLDDLRRHVTFLKILGSYAKSDPKRPIRIEKERIRPCPQVNGQAAQ